MPHSGLETNQNISLNFSIAKVIAIFTVVAGHWFTGTILWIPVTCGLFIFAFSSAYFTSTIYGVNIDRKRFWQKKLQRLGLRFWIILFFLTAILIVQGKPVLHWHTALHFVGLSGVLNWLSIANQSALGAGLWFFTLLLIFYIAYPYLANASKSTFAAKLIALFTVVAAIFLEQNVKVGHELWLTSLGFVLGVVYGLHGRRLNPQIAFLVFILTCISLAVVNLFTTYREFNTLLITLASISISLWLSSAVIPDWSLIKRLAGLEDYLLEIFLIHTYLFVHISGKSIPDFLSSVVLIVVVAMILGRFSSHLSTLLFNRDRVMA